MKSSRARAGTSITHDENRTPHDDLLPFIVAPEWSQELFDGREEMVLQLDLVLSMVPIFVRVVSCQLLPRRRSMRRGGQEHRWGRYDNAQLYVYLHRLLSGRCSVVWNSFELSISRNGPNRRNETWRLAKRGLHTHMSLSDDADFLHNDLIDYAGLEICAYQCMAHQGESMTHAHMHTCTHKAYSV